MTVCEGRSIAMTSRSKITPIFCWKVEELEQSIFIDHHMFILMSDLQRAAHIRCWCDAVDCDPVTIEE